MQTELRVISAILRLLPFILLPFLLMLVASCDESSSDDDMNPIVKHGNFVSYTLNGPVVNGDFTIVGKQSPTDEHQGNAVGDQLPGDEKFRLRYNDLEQDLSVQLIFPNKKGTFNIKDFFLGDLDGRLSVFVGGAARIGESGSITVSEIRFSGTGSALKMSVKGSFQGVVENFDLNLNQQFKHDISGDFELDNY